jgi:hypothetical protein
MTKKKRKKKKEKRKMENPDKLQSFSMALILHVRLRPCAKAVKKQEHHFSWGEEKFPSAFFSFSHFVNSPLCFALTVHRVNGVLNIH